MSTLVCIKDGSLREVNVGRMEVEVSNSYMMMMVMRRMRTVDNIFVGRERKKRIL